MQRDWDDSWLLLVLKPCFAHVCFWNKAVAICCTYFLQYKIPKFSFKVFSSSLGLTKLKQIYKLTWCYFEGDGEFKTVFKKLSKSIKIFLIVLLCALHILCVGDFQVNVSMYASKMSWKWTENNHFKSAKVWNIKQETVLLISTCFAVLERLESLIQSFVSEEMLGIRQPSMYLDLNDLLCQAVQGNHCEEGGWLRSNMDETKI